MKSYKCRTVFQVLIQPGSYSVSKETIGVGEEVIDSKFDNSEMEWLTNEYGLLIKAEQQVT